MTVPKKLTDELTNLQRTVEGFYESAAEIDQRSDAAERRAAEAEAQAAKDQKAKQEAEAKVDGLQQQIVKAHADVAGQVETLIAEKEQLAQRDHDSRQELDHLRLTKAYRETRGFTEPQRKQTNA